MRRSSGWYSGALALALLGTAAGPLAAQTGDEESEEDPCVCVDAEEIHEHTREAMEEARHAMRRAREQMRGSRFEVAPRPPEFRDGHRAPGPAVHPPPPAFPPEFRGGLEGLKVADLDPDLGEYFGTDEGVLITGVSEDSDLGLRSGDVVLRVGDREVGNSDDLRRILRSYAEDEEVHFRVRRSGAELDVTGTMP